MHRRATHIIDPLDSGLKFSQTEMDLNRKYDSPVSFPVGANLGLCAATEW
jgi:hypothetical protein